MYISTMRDVRAIDTILRAAETYEWLGERKAASATFSRIGRWKAQRKRWSSAPICHRANKRDIRLKFLL
jgi:hypothetical protein